MGAVVNVCVGPKASCHRSRPAAGSSRRCPAPGRRSLRVPPSLRSDPRALRRRGCSDPTLPFPVFKPVARARPSGGDRAGERDIGSTDSEALSALRRGVGMGVVNMPSLPGRARAARVFDDKAVVVYGPGSRPVTCTLATAPEPAERRRPSRLGPGVRTLRWTRISVRSSRAGRPAGPALRSSLRSRRPVRTPTRSGRDRLGREGNR